MAPRTLYEKIWDDHAIGDATCSTSTCTWSTR